MANPDVLRIDDLGFAYTGEAALIDHWSATIAPGAMLLFGDTGSGKSTLLRLLAGALPASHGRLTLNGACLDADPPAYRRQVFLADPATDRYDAISARACTAALREGDTAFDDARWHELVDGFGLAPHIDKPVYMLSTGSRRKVWLAAALASGRALTLLDEPAGALDAASSACLWRTLAELADHPRRAIVVASAERPERVAWRAVIELPLRD